MKLRITLLFSLVFNTIFSFGQDVKSQLNQYSYPGLTAQQVDSLKKAIINSVFNNPELYNDAYAKFLGSYKSDSSQLFNFMRDLNVRFKTFQTDAIPATLGFEYNYNNSWTKSRTNNKFSGFQTYELSFNGNVAAQKSANPFNLIESALKYNSSLMWGGKVKRLDTASRNKLVALNHAIIQANIAGNNKLVRQLYLQRGDLIKTTNQYYAGINGNFTYETTQDFSRRQFVPSLLVNLGAKAWDPNEALRYFNIPDYPFALIRLITGTDSKFSISGASFPSFLVGLDYVIPDQDSVRQSLSGNLHPYNRFKTEVAFKTKAAMIANQMIFCSADFR